jgi:hypothetical protein
MNGQSAPRTFLNPEFYANVTDTSPFAFNGGAQADTRLTPFIHLELNDNAPNDAAPIYAAHNCNYTLGAPLTNGGCVAMVPIVTSTAGDKHAGIEAINAIVQIGTTDPIAQAQGIELNQFNNSGSNSRLQDNFTFTRGPYFGISATAGGANTMVAGFNVQDQAALFGNPLTGWQYGLLVERAIDAGVYIFGSPVGLKQAATGFADATHNFGSIPIELDGSFYNGTLQEPIATTISATTPAGTSGNACLDVGFSFVPHEFTTCADGTTNVGVLNASSGVHIAGGSSGSSISFDILSGAPDIEVGGTTTALPSFIDFHSGGHSVDYDTRILSTGGTTMLGQGTMNLIVGSLQMNGAPGLTHTITLSCGTISFVNGLLVGVTGSC